MGTHIGNIGAGIRVYILCDAGQIKIGIAPSIKDSSSFLAQGNALVHLPQ